VSEVSAEFLSRYIETLEKSYETFRNSLVKNFKMTLEQNREPEVKFLEQLSRVKYE
jgi:hypothetical protein